MKYVDFLLFLSAVKYNNQPLGGDVKREKESWQISGKETWTVVFCIKTYETSSSYQKTHKLIIIVREIEFPNAINLCSSIAQNDTRKKNIFFCLFETLKKFFYSSYFSIMNFKYFIRGSRRDSERESERERSINDE